MSCVEWKGEWIERGADMKGVIKIAPAQAAIALATAPATATTMTIEKDLITLSN